MAEQLPDALHRHNINRVISSPQRRAVLTARPLADALAVPIEVDERLAEYDYGLSEYVPVEQMLKDDPQQFARLLSGDLPAGVDADQFKARVIEAADQIVATGNHRDRLAVVCHGGVINVLLHRILGTPALFPFPIDYVSITHLRYSADGQPSVLGVNNIEHVWNLLPRLMRR